MSKHKAKSIPPKKTGKTKVTVEQVLSEIQTNALILVDNANRQVEKGTLIIQMSGELLHFISTNNAKSNPVPSKDKPKP